MQVNSAEKLSKPFKGSFIPPISISMNASAYEALEKMQEQGIHHLLVTDNDEAVGTLSDRDLYKQMFGAATEGVLHTRDFSIIHAMRRPIQYVSEDTSVEDALKWMEELGVDVLLSKKAGAIVGLVTQKDILRAMSLFYHRPKFFDQLAAESEAFISLPLVQNLMKTLENMGV